MEMYVNELQYLLFDVCNFFKTDKERPPTLVTLRESKSSWCKAVFLSDLLKTMNHKVAFLSQYDGQCPRCTVLFVPLVKVEQLRTFVNSVFADYWKVWHFSISAEGLFPLWERMEGCPGRIVDERLWFSTGQTWFLLLTE